MKTSEFWVFQNFFQISQTAALPATYFLSYSCPQNAFLSFFFHTERKRYICNIWYIFEKLVYCVFIFLQNFNLNFNNILTAKENNVIPIIRNHFEIAWLIQSKAKYWSKIYASKILHYQKSDFCYIHEKD